MLKPRVQESINHPHPTLGSSILQFSLLPSIKLIRESTAPHTCAEDELINDIVYRNETLALIITNKSDKSIRMELRSVETLDRIWSLRLDILTDNNIRFTCCLLTGNQWLVADHENGRLLHITKDGEMKKTIEYNPPPNRICLFRSNILVISKLGGVNFHNLSLQLNLYFYYDHQITK